MLFIVKNHPKDYLLQRCQGPLQWINLMDTTVIKLSKLPKIWTVIGYHKPLDVKLGGHIIIHGVFLEKQCLPESNYNDKIRQIQIEGHAAK